MWVLDMMCKNTKLWTPGVGATLMAHRAHDVQRRGATLMSHFSATHPLQNGPISIILDPKWLIPWS